MEPTWSQYHFVWFLGYPKPFSWSQLLTRWGTNQIRMSLLSLPDDQRFGLSKSPMFLSNGSLDCWKIDWKHELTWATLKTAFLPGTTERKKNTFLPIHSYDMFDVFAFFGIQLWKIFSILLTTCVVFGSPVGQQQQRKCAHVASSSSQSAANTWRFPSRKNWHPISFPLSIPHRELHGSNRFCTKSIQQLFFEWHRFAWKWWIPYLFCWKEFWWQTMGIY